MHEVNSTRHCKQAREADQSDFARGHPQLLLCCSQEKLHGHQDASICTSSPAAGLPAGCEQRSKRCASRVCMPCTIYTSLRCLVHLRTVRSVVVSTIRGCTLFLSAAKACCTALMRFVKDEYLATAGPWPCGTLAQDQQACEPANGLRTSVIVDVPRQVSAWG